MPPGLHSVTLNLVLRSALQTSQRRITPPSLSNADRGRRKLDYNEQNRPACLQDQFAPAARRVPEVVRESDPKPDVNLGACPEDYSRGAQSRGDNGGDAGTSAITLATVSAVSCLGN